MVLLSVAVLSPAPPAQEASQEPRDIGLQEKAASRLVQIDVSIDAPEDVLRALTPADFELVVNSRFVDEFLVDYACPDRPETEPVVTGEDAGSIEPPEPAPARTRYIFYFDQIHLTMPGRQRAIDMARVLAPQLVTRGSTASVISSAAKLRTFVADAGDPQAILAALDELERDHTQFSEYAQLEDQRLEDIRKAQINVDLNHAITTARRYQKEERWNTEKALRRMAMVIGRLADAPPPKAVVYFADTMRPNAGEHYSYGFGSNYRDTTLSLMNTDGLTARNPYDRVVEAAGSFGVRLYTIQAQGLIPSSARLRDAQGGLTGFALETGGRAFLNGAPSRRVADYIRRDLVCPLLISFPAEGFPLDRALSVRLRVLRAGVEAKTRGQIVIQSEGKQRTSRLMAAFASPQQAEDATKLHGVVVPTSFVDGKFSALVQVQLPASPLGSSAWDIGTSVITKERVTSDAAGRVELDRAGVPVVFEAEMEFPPGEYEIATVAHETATDQIASAQVAGALPRPREQDASLGPLIVMQPRKAAFLRDGEPRDSGPVAVPPSEPLRTDLPTAIVGMVCRARPKKDLYVVERVLRGEAIVSFPTLQLDRTEERCTQFRDLIPTGMMTTGGFVYEAKVLEQGFVIVEGTTEFVALDPDDPLLDDPAEP